MVVWSNLAQPFGCKYTTAIDDNGPWRGADPLTFVGYVQTVGGKPKRHFTTEGHATREAARAACEAWLRERGYAPA